MKLRYHSTGCVYSLLVEQEMHHKREQEAAEKGRRWEAEEEAKARHNDKAEACREDEAEVFREAEAKACHLEAEACSMADEAKDYNTCNCTWIDGCTHCTVKTTEPEENTESMASEDETEIYDT